MRRRGALGPGIELAAVLVRRPRARAAADRRARSASSRSGSMRCWNAPAMQAVREHGVRCLEAGADLVLTSIGALIDEALRARLYHAAEAAGRRLVIASAGIGALDILAAAAVGGLERVAMTVRKDPSAWYGTAAESFATSRRSRSRSRSTTAACARAPRATRRTSTSARRWRSPASASTAPSSRSSPIRRSRRTSSRSRPKAPSAASPSPRRSVPSDRQPEDRQAGRDGRDQDDPPARGAGRDRRLSRRSGAGRRAHGPAVPAHGIRARCPAAACAACRLPMSSMPITSGGLTRRSKTSIGAALRATAHTAYSTSTRCMVTRRPLSSFWSPAVEGVGSAAREEPHEVVEPELLERRRIVGIGAVDDLAEAAVAGHVDPRQAAFGIELGQPGLLVDQDVAEHHRVGLRAAVEEVRAVARLPEEDVGAGAAEGAVGVGRAGVGPADLDVVAGPAQHRVDAEQADLDVGPPGADQDVAVLQASDRGRRPRAPGPPAAGTDCRHCCCRRRSAPRRAPRRTMGSRRSSGRARPDAPDAAKAKPPSVMDGPS